MENKVEEEKKFCLFCKKELLSTKQNKKVNPKRKFCNHQCCTRYNAKQYYLKNKNDPNYRKKAFIRFKKWVEGNRSHFNDLVREPNKILRKKNYYKWKEAGLCVTCGKKRESEILVCRKCSDRKKNITP